MTSAGAAAEEDRTEFERRLCIDLSLFHPRRRPRGVVLLRPPGPPSLPLCRLSQQVRIHTAAVRSCDCPPPPPRLFAGLESSAGSGAAAGDTCRLRAAQQLSRAWQHCAAQRSGGWGTWRRHSPTRRRARVALLSALVAVWSVCPQANPPRATASTARTSRRQPTRSSLGWRLGLRSREITSTSTATS